MSFTGRPIQTLALIRMSSIPLIRTTFLAPSRRQLYGIDTGLDILVTQVASNRVRFGTVGAIGLNASAAGGFDVSGVTGTAYAALLPSGSSQSSLYTINLATGLATPVGVINGGLVISALTVAPVPEPASIALVAHGRGGHVRGSPTGSLSFLCFVFADELPKASW